MKALRILATFILGVASFILILLFGTLTAGRMWLSGNNFSSLIKDIAKQSDEFDVSKVFGNDITISSQEFEDAVEEMKEYGIDVDKIYDEFGDFASQVIRYSVGMTDEIDTSGLKKVLKDTAKKYEAKTGNEIDLDSIDEDIDKGVKEMKRDIRDSKKENKEVFDIMASILNTKTYYGILIGIIVCAALIILVNKSVVPLGIIYIITSVFGILFNLIFFVLAKFVRSENELAVELLLNSLGKTFLIIALAFVVLLILSIVAIVIGKKQKKVITT